VRDHVRAEFERILQVGAREGVVDSEYQPLAVCDLRTGRDVDHAQHGIRRALDPEHLRRRVDGRLDFIENGRIDEREADAEAGHHLRKQAVTSSVEIIANDDVIPRG